MGPNLAAILSYFSGRHHLGKRGIEELVETVFEVPISLGMVTTLESEMSAALAPAHDEAKDEVRAAAVKNADETGWKQAGRRCWLWMAATATVAYFVIHARRNVAGLQALLGEAIQGIVGSDRWGAYNKLPLHQRQICWAHLKRDFQKLIDRGGPAEAIGRVGMDVVECLFADWWAFRRGDLDRAGLQVAFGPDGARTPRGFGAGLWLRGPESGGVLRECPGVVSGVVAVRGGRGGGTDEQPCGTAPAAGCAVAEERVRESQRGGMPVRGADADGGADAAVAEGPGAGLPATCDDRPSVRPPRPAIAGPKGELNGYNRSFQGSFAAPARVASRCPGRTFPIGIATCRVRTVRALVSDSAPEFGRRRTHRWYGQRPPP